MIEHIIEQFIAEGKISREEIEAGIAKLKAEQPQPPVHMTVEELRQRQEETANTMVFLLDITLGGM